MKVETLLAKLWMYMISASLIISVILLLIEKEPGCFMDLTGIKQRILTVTMCCAIGIAILLIDIGVHIKDHQNNQQ